MATEDEVTYEPTGEELVLLRDGQPLAMVAPLAGQADLLRAALREAGIEMAQVTVEAEVEVIVEAAAVALDKECSIEDKRPCELKTALGVAHDVARDAGLPSYGTLSAIVERGVTSEQEASEVLQQWAAEVQDSPNTDSEQRNWADVITNELFPTPKGGA